ncbi:MAG TPA: thioredoxin family protein [Draconibacterium sp.]|nr:thioredoxin family protein [Draconibacterium sp.]
MARKILVWLIFGGMAIVFILAYLNKNVLNDFISIQMKKMTDTETNLTAEELVDSKYNYEKNGLNYEFTLLEFGSTGCTICKRMEGELAKIKSSNPNSINVAFLNTTQPENQNLVKYFGIAAIPMQVLLDKNGTEFFKHYGFISAEDLIAKTLENTTKE